MNLLPDWHRTHFPIPVSAGPAAPAILSGPLNSRARFALPALALVAGTMMFASAPSAQAQNTTDTVVSGTSLALDSAASYNAGLPGATSDVVFSLLNTYGGTYTINANPLTIGTLDDFSTTAIAITGTQALTLNLGTNAAAIPPTATGSALQDSTNPADLLYVAPGSTLTYGGVGGIVLGAAGGNIDIASSNFSGTAANGVATINSVISDGGHGYGFSKTGVGTLTLTAANTYTGATNVVQGNLTLNFAAAGAPASNIISASSALALGGYTTSGGGSLYAPTEAAENPTLLATAATGGSTQTFNGLTVNPGTDELIARGNGSGNMTVSLGAIAVNRGGSINFSRNGTGSTGTGTFQTSNATDASGLISGVGGAGVINATTANSAGFAVPTDYATVSGGTIVPYTGYTVVGTVPGYGTTTAPLVASDTTKNLKIDNTSTVSLALLIGGTTAGSKNVTVTSTDGLYVGAVVTGTGIPANSTVTAVTNGTTFTISNAATTTNIGLTITEASIAIPLATLGITDVNTIVMSDSAARDISISAGNTLRLGANGGILTSAGPFVVGGNAAFGGTIPVRGSLTAGGSTNNPGTINLEVGTGLLTINANIVNNGTGVVTLVINDYAATFNNTAVSLGGTNTFTGGIFINSGRLAAGSTNVGTGTITIGPAGQLFSQGGTFTNALVLEGSGGGNNNSLFDTPSALRVGTYSGKVTLAGDAGVVGVTLNGQITGPGGITFGKPQNNGPSGGTTLGNTSTTNLNNYQGNTVLTENTLTLNANNQIPSANTLAADTGNVIFNAAAGNGNATLNLNGFSNTINGLSSQGIAAGAPGAGIVTNSATGASVLTLGANNASATFNGLLSDSGTGRTLAITKIGTGTQVFGGASTYIGATTVNAGTLLINGSIGTGVTPSGAVTINSGGTLGGSGILTVTSATVAAGSMLAPGATIGATTGALTLNTITGLTLNGALSISLGTTGTNGTFLTSAGGLTVSGATLTLSGTPTIGTVYDLVNYSGTLTANGSNDGFATINGPAGFNYSVVAGTTFGVSDLELTVTAVPEPSTWVGAVLAVLAVVGTLGIELRRRKVRVG